MKNNPHGFRDELIASEPVNFDLQVNYEQEMDKMFTQELKGISRVGWWANYLVLLLFGCFLLAGAIFEQPFTLGPIGRWLWAIPGVFTIVISILGMKVGWNKKMDLRKDSKFLATVGAVGMHLVAYSILLIAFLSGNMQTMAFLAPIAMLIIIIGMLVGLVDRVQQGELNTRENLLEIKLHLAQLDERLQGGKRD